MQLENGETGAVLTPEQGQALWDEVAAEKDVAAERPPVKPVKAEPVKVDPAPVVAADPHQVALSELEAKFDKRLRELNGQFGGLKGDQLKLQETMNAAQKAAKQVSEAPTQAQMAAASNNKEKWAALEAQYPEWTQAFEHRVSQIPKFDAEAIEKMVAERVKGESTAVRQEIISNTLDAVYPGWEDEVKSEQFGKWVKGHAEWRPEFDDAKTLADPNSPLSKFIAANKNSPVALYFSGKVGDAAKMLRMYEASKSTSVASNLTQQRQEILNSASGGAKRGVKTPPVKGVADMSPQELWNHEARLRDQRRSRGY